MRLIGLPLILAVGLALATLTAEVQPAAKIPDVVLRVLALVGLDLVVRLDPERPRRLGRKGQHDRPRVTPRDAEVDLLHAASLS